MKVSNEKPLTGKMIMSVTAPSDTIGSREAKPVTRYSPAYRHSSHLAAPKMNWEGVLIHIREQLVFRLIFSAIQLNDVYILIQR